MDELAAALANDAEILLLQPHLKSFLVLRWLRRGEEFSLRFRAADEWDRMAELLRSLGIDRVHVHHVHGLPQALLELPRRLGCAHDVTLHDYFPICPAYHLTDANARFCGGEPRCQRCCDAGPAQWPLSIDEWRAAFGAFLAAAERIIAPSEDCAERLRRHIPSLSPLVWPHPKAEHAVAAAPVRVLVPGAISPAKGLDVLEACARDAGARSLPLHFRVLGYLARTLPTWPELPFTLSGEYRDGTLPQLLALERGDVVFFPAQCPETFSYTLSDALDTALPIVATDLGALPERLAHRANARVVHWDAPAAEINAALLAAAEPRAAGTPSKPPGMTFERYCGLYLEGVRAAGPRATNAPMPSIEPHWLEPAHEPMPQWTLAEAFEDAIGCGRARSLEELRQRTREADVRLACLADELAGMRGVLAQGEIELARRVAELTDEAKRAELMAARTVEELARTFERSTSWRLTAPLRAFKRWWGRHG